MSAGLVSNGGFRRALGFLTPLGGAAPPGGLAWFAPVGALVGGGVGGTWWLAARAFPVFVAATLAVVADLVLTGMLHLDGLADAADGLLAPLDRSRRLAAMGTPDVGAFGVGVVVVVLVLRAGSLAALHPSVVLIAALWAMSRAGMAATVVRVPYARTGGLATAFVGEATPAVGVAAGLGLVAAVGLAATWRLVAGPVAVVAGLAAGAAVVVLARRRLGGFTGDVLGAAGMVGETVGLVVACARW